MTQTQEIVLIVLLVVLLGLFTVIKKILLGQDRHQDWRRGGMGQGGGISQGMGQGDGISQGMGQGNGNGQGMAQSSGGISYRRPDDDETTLKMR